MSRNEIVPIPMRPPLQNLSHSETVENVYIFIADSVKSETTSEDVTSIGISGRAIAASTYTASSFPSILSGHYPSTHKVWSFSDRLAHRPKLIEGPENFGISAETIWTHLSPRQKPPLKMIRVNENEAKSINNLEEPFVGVEHHKGGHMPYGKSFNECGSTEEFFENICPKLDNISNLYQKSVNKAESAFLDRISQLEKEGILDNTLVIYTSDHGEALGEAKNGMAIGHGEPIVPDIVNVPVVFAGAGLPNLNLDTVVSGVDIAPTARSALDHKFSDEHDGLDLWTGSSTIDRLIRSELWISSDLPYIGNVDRYKATSVWDKSGGFVFHHGSSLTRFTMAVGNELVRAPWSYLNRNPRNLGRWVGLAKSYLPSVIRYKSPNVSISEAKSEIHPFARSTSKQEETINKEQLRKLGYLE
jgi:hypothetical protein